MTMLLIFLSFIGWHRRPSWRTESRDDSPKQTIQEQMLNMTHNASGFNPTISPSGLVQSAERAISTFFSSSWSPSLPRCLESQQPDSSFGLTRFEQSDQWMMARKRSSTSELRIFRLPNTRYCIAGLKGAYSLIDSNYTGESSSYLPRHLRFYLK